MNVAPTLHLPELRARLEAPAPPLLIDVMPEEEFAAAHLPAARNACVYNVTFLEDVRTLAPDFAAPLVVYGSSVRNLASATAAEKLIAAGYTRVSDFRGGLEEWKSGKQPCEGNPSLAPLSPLPRDGRHEIDLQRSRVEWTGRSLLGAHTGTLRLSAGHLEVKAGQPIGAAFTLDMHSITNTDIEGPEMREMLISHLKSDDFFDVANHPLASFELARIAHLSNATPGTPNAEITGVLTLKGIANEIAFRAILAPTPEGTLAADAHLEIDRTQWKILYGSGKFYEKLGKHLVNDIILLALKVVTLPKQ